MTWLAWRQFRIPAIVGAACLAVLLGALLFTWWPVRDLAVSTGYTGCTGNDCVGEAYRFLEELEQSLASRVQLAGSAASFGLPALVGVFWGAPMVAREFETGTYRIAWSQTVSRRRWLLVKLSIGGLAAALVAGALSLALTNWAQPIDDAHASLAHGGGPNHPTLITPLVFPTRGVVPIGYATLAFAIGVTVGLMLRKTLAAMAVTLALVVATQIGAVELRPLIADPVHRVTALTAERADSVTTMNDVVMKVEGRPSEADAWQLSNTIVATPGGPEYRGPTSQEKCTPDCHEWVGAQGLLQEERYVPARRFWLVQWRELGVLLTLTAALSLISLWWIRRRPA